MNIDADNQEALREALLNLDRLREQEKSARLQMEALVGGLQVLNECQNVSDMYREILSCLYGLIAYDSATILIEDVEGYLSSAVSSDNRLRFNRVPIKGVFQRCLNGRATTLTDLSVVEDWPTIVSESIDENDASSKLKALRSALLVVLPSPSTRMMLVSASETKAAFKRKDLALLQSFAPLATQAVHRALEMEKLNYLAATLDHQAHFDLLTGLPNRLLFEKILRRLESTDKQYSILFVDLDNFKTINDTFGHATGDILLSEIGFRMSFTVGENDTIARMGGDEFAFIIQSTSTREGLKALCEKIIDSIRQPLFLRNSRIIPTASIGVLFAPSTDIHIQQKMQKADIAMYHAKSAGRNQYCFFDDKMRSEIQLEFDIESQLPMAIEQKNFHLVYQPIFDSSTMKGNRIEVLVRWGGSGSAHYGPHKFIPIAEKTGNIVELGRWIVQQSFVELGDWLKQDSERRISLNVSQLELQRSGFADDFIQQAKFAKIDCNQIELELSEHIVADYIDSIVSENIKALRSRGICFAFDDFGTGNSSLLHLQKFPGTSLKIDKSFIDHIVESDEQRRLVAGMIDFAHIMGMSVVAEGVETESQMKLLTVLGADYLQGYLLARPARVEDILALLSEWHSSANPKLSSGN